MRVITSTPQAADSTDSARYLIATATPDLWPSDGELIFVGEWCKRYSQRAALEGRKFSTVPYHWNDQDQLQSDYEYLGALYTKLMPRLATKLNDFHDTAYSERYWKIICGWWFRCFLQILFDRWRTLQVALELYPDASIVVSPRYDDIKPCSDVEDFLGRSISDEWNQAFYQQLAAQTSVRCVSFSVDCNDFNKGRPTKGDFVGRQSALGLQALTKRLLGSRRSRRAWTSEYLSFKQRGQISWQARQRMFMFRGPGVSYKCPSVVNREWSLAHESGDPFFDLSCELVAKHLPLAYLEGYRDVKQVASRQPWPTAPKEVLTSNALYGDEVWKLWAASKVEAGAELLVMQHGGHYGTARLSSMLDHELDICDRYMSWGWDKFNESKIQPATALRLANIAKYSDGKRDDCLLIANSYPRYAYFLASHPMGGQFDCYIKEQLEFAAALRPDVRDSLRVRLYPHDYGWDEKLQWLERFPNVNIPDSSISMKRLRAGARISVITLNATSLLESLASGHPTVIFWNPSHWELSKEAIPYFEALEVAGVFFRTPLECAEQVNRVFDDPQTWWNAAQVQEAVTAFTDRFADLRGAPVARLVTAVAHP